jgi:hypothetical protein
MGIIREAVFSLSFLCAFASLREALPLFVMEISFDFVQFENLQEALIDASSIIYMSKASFLGNVQETLRLYTLPEILDEVGLENMNLPLVESQQSEMSNDHKLLACAVERRWPLISEDRTLLVQAEQAGLDYYNALMMLNFLLFKRQIDSEQYQQQYESLRKVARYSQEIWEFGEDVYRLITTGIRNKQE